MKNILVGVVGSTAYGLNGPHSDVDRIGVFATNTVNLHGLHMPDETVVHTRPDITMHEARKYCALSLRCNPTVMELMWLPDELYIETSPLGEALIGIRTAFLSAPLVRSAYLGYADQQFKRLESRGDGSFSADTRKRTAKHARHLARLLVQGDQLYAEGTLTVRLSDPDRIRAFGDEVAAGGIDAARQVIADAERRFNLTSTPLPGRPDVEAVEAWLRRVRRAHLSPDEK